MRFIGGVVVVGATLLWCEVRGHGRCYQCRSQDRVSLRLSKVSTGRQLGHPSSALFSRPVFCVEDENTIKSSGELVEHQK